MTLSRTRLATIALVVSASVASIAVPARAQAPESASCDDFLLPPRDVAGKKVGPASCLRQETPLTLSGRQFVRLDIGLDGTVDGYITKTGDYKEYLTNAPDLVFGQTADTGERLLAMAKYEREKGAAMTLVFPRERSAWNGKLWVTVHGRGASFKEGQPRRGQERRRRPAGRPQKCDKRNALEGIRTRERRTSSAGLGETSRRSRTV